MGSLEGPRHFDVVRAPFDCILREVNSRLLSDPRLANKDSFGEGWFAVLEQIGSASTLLTLAKADALIASTVKRLGIRCFSEFPDVEMYEVGSECAAVLVRLNDLMKKALPGTVVHLASDDPVSDSEISTWTEMTGNKMVESRLDGVLHHYILKKR